MGCCQSSNTPQHWTPKSVKKLAKPGECPDIKNQYGEPALLWAANDGHLELVQKLVYARANLNIRNGYGDTALIWAALKSHNEIADLLLSAGANPNIQNKDGYTALFWAIHNSNIELIKLLLQSNVNIHIRKKGKTALQLAKTPAIKQLLLDHQKLELFLAITAAKRRDYTFAYYLTKLPEKCIQKILSYLA